MIRLVLSAEEKDCLATIAAPQVGLDFVEIPGGRFQCDISEDTSDDLRELCVEELQVSGFGPDEQPRARGRMLETLIDKLYVP
jgi:hypothetical protein